MCPVDSTGVSGIPRREEIGIQGHQGGMTVALKIPKAQAVSSAASTASAISAAATAISAATTGTGSYSSLD